MKVIKSKTLLSYISLLLPLSLIEVIFRLISGGKLINFSFLRVFILINFISLFVGFLSSLLKKKTYVVNGIVVLIATIYGLAQLMFFNYLGVYISLNTSSQFGAVKDYIFEFLSSIKPIYLLILIPFVLYVLNNILFNKLSILKSKLNKFKKKYLYENELNLITVTLLLLSLGLSFYHLLDPKYSDSFQVMSNKDLFKSASNPGLCVKEFGVLSFGLIDIKSKFIQSEDEDLYFAYTEPELDPNRMYDDQDWLEIIDEEKNQVLNNLNNYYINNQISSKNEMTGLFKDKNLIVIMLESVNDIIFNEEYFPNFYKMASEGWYFENNYSPRNSCATGNNEFSAMTGLYSIYNACTSNVYLNNTYFTSIFNLFNNAGYYTNSAHNYTESYYYRNTIHKNMGSQQYYGVQALDMSFFPYYGGWSSDEDFMNSYLNIVDIYEKDVPFMSFLTTVTSHQPYSASSVYGDMYLDMTKDTNYSMDLRRYLSKLKVLDNALGILLEGLDARGILDDTIIVMFGDHYPYGISLNTLNQILERDLNNYENEKVPLVIYNPELESKKESTYTSYLNLTPTLANLFDLEFDPRLYAGVDIYSPEYKEMVVFADSSWKNAKAYYNAATGEITYFTDFIYTGDEIKEINLEIYAKMNSSNLAIKNNYFNYLKLKLETKKAEKMEIENNEEGKDA